MKTPLILFSVVSIAAYLLWFGYHALRGLGAAYGNANPATGPGDLTLLFVVVGVLTAACVVYSFFAPAGIARYVALAPVALVLLGHGFIACRRDANRARHQQGRAADRAAQEALLARISKDYVRGEEARFTEILSSFLTHDLELHTLVRIDVDYESKVSAYGIGKINGGHLDTVERLDENYYRRYVDREGKTIFDRYALGQVLKPDAIDFHLEKYRP